MRLGRTTFPYPVEMAAVRGRQVLWKLRGAKARLFRELFVLALHLAAVGLRCPLLHRFQEVLPELLAPRRACEISTVSRKGSPSAPSLSHFLEAFLQPSERLKGLPLLHVP
jgi:hypothetical protein